MGDRSVSPAEAVTARLYAWERRLRGWEVLPYPVPLEPVFRPYFHALPGMHACDDGRRSGLGERILRLFGLGNAPLLAPVPLDVLLADEWGNESVSEDVGREHRELLLQLPESLLVEQDRAERLVQELGSLSGPVSFELVGARGSVMLQLAVALDDAADAHRILETLVPDVTITESGESLRDMCSGGSRDSWAVVGFGLGREAMLPFRPFSSRDVDTLAGMLSILDSISVNECGVVQVSFVRCAYPWGESFVRAVSDGRGRAFFSDQPETLQLARSKASEPLCACTIRVAGRADSRERAFDIARRLGASLALCARPGSNELMPLSNEEYPEADQVEDMLVRQSRRVGMLLSIPELCSIVHIPTPEVRPLGLRAEARRSKELPATARTGDVLLGVNKHRGVEVEVHVPAALRLRHMYVLGATGTGKSTLLRELIRQDAKAGRGLCLIDPHGDLVDDVCGLIPEDRHGDIVLIDPADEECPVGINVLQARTDRQRDVLASDLVSVFRRLSTSWGDQMTAVLGNALMALLHSDRPSTLLELRRFLVDRSFRETWLASVDDPVVCSFFREDFPRLYGRPQTPILTRLDAFLRPRQIRAVVCQSQAAFSMAEAMERGQIVLVRLAQGAIGEENASLLGSILVSQIHQAALGRESLNESARRDFFVYLDEFHHFRSPSLGALLSGARKFHVGLVLAHQELRQLGERELEAALLTNAATRMCFRLGDDDARRLAEGCSDFVAADFQRLGIGEAICRIERADQDFNLQVVRSPALGPEVASKRVGEVRRRSQALYGTPRTEIDAAIARSLGTAAKGEADSPPVARVPRESRGSPAPMREPLETVPKVQGQPLAKRSSAQAKRQVPRDEEVLAGRGGPEHKYLQALIKRYGEERGFRVTLEAPVSGGGRVDVLLVRDELSIACEISISSTAAQEVGNLRKCMRGGFSRIVLVSPARRTLRQVKKLVAQELGDAAGVSVEFCTPEELLLLLDVLDAGEEARETTVHGYKVRTSLAARDPSQDPERRGVVARTIVEALRRLRRDA